MANESKIVSLLGQIWVYAIKRKDFIRDKVSKGKVKLLYCKSEDNLADLLTKPLKKNRFEDLRNKMMIMIE